jgi:hypothetical protein
MAKSRDPAALESSLYLLTLRDSRRLDARKGVVGAEMELWTTLGAEG